MYPDHPRDRGRALSLVLTWRVQPRVRGWCAAAPYGSAPYLQERTSAARRCWPPAASARYQARDDGGRPWYAASVSGGGSQPRCTCARTTPVQGSHPVPGVLAWPASCELTMVRGRSVRWGPRPHLQERLDAAWRWPPAGPSPGVRKDDDGSWCATVVSAIEIPFAEVASSAEHHWPDFGER